MYEASISEKTELRLMIILEQSGVKARGEKRGISERRENIMEREKSRAKRETRRVVRISERRARKLV